MQAAEPADILQVLADPPLAVLVAGAMVEKTARV
jgi:hypothetical protein